jgi:1-deoxy-D-xylulose-5-phosphate reductoisomerase
VISDPTLESRLAELLQERSPNTELLTGPSALEQLAALPEVDTVMAGIVGAAGLRPTLAAARHGKRVLLANKESMVIAGPLLSRAVQENGSVLIPVDSEHNALFQALPERYAEGLQEVGVERLILTASGGPFLDATPEMLETVTPEQACAHPKWNMGRKISVDSATLMNKGLEVIEASGLFNAGPEQIEVLIHPQSIVHSMVAYRDGSVLAQLGVPDMRTPIAHALAWPERIEAGVEPLDLASAGPLEFRPPDLARFPCLGLAFEALTSGGDAAVTLNAANEVAVQAFLDRKIPFMQIPVVVERTLAATATRPVESLDEVLEADRLARQLATGNLERKVSISV